MDLVTDMGIPYGLEEFVEENQYASDRSYDELSFVTLENPSNLEVEVNRDNQSHNDRVLDAIENFGSPSFTSNTWIGDIGASTTTTNDDSGMYDVRFIDKKVKAFLGHLVQATKLGKKKLRFQQKDGTFTEQVINQVKYCPKGD